MLRSNGIFSQNTRINHKHISCQLCEITGGGGHTISIWGFERGKALQIAQEKSISSLQRIVAYFPSTFYIFVPIDTIIINSRRLDFISFPIFIIIVSIIILLLYSFRR